MRIDSTAWPFVALSAIPAVVAALVAPPVALVLLLLPVAVALFFRDPDRASPTAADIVLAPADGRVTHAGAARSGEAPPGAWLQVTIFLSLLDVHINRTPVAGRVTRVDYRPGRHLAAFRRDAHANEQSEIWLESAGGTVVVRQVVGLLARRVVCRVTPGDVLAPGARIGLMKFGSRMDVFLPPGATLATSAGATVRSGATVIARLPEAAP